jgi:hypothetical protein
LAGNKEQASVPCSRIGQSGAQLGHLHVAPDKRITKQTGLGGSDTGRANECLKPITPGRHGDDKPGRIGVIIQCAANLTHGGVDAVLADEDALAPDLLENFFASHELSATLDQKT